MEDFDKEGGGQFWRNPPANLTLKKSLCISPLFERARTSKRDLVKIDIQSPLSHIYIEP